MDSKSRGGIAPDLSVVIPCYNEALNLPRLFERVSNVIPSDFSMEVLFVNNGSTDNSAQVFTDLQRQYTFARTITVPTNQGYGHGILTGLRGSTGRAIAWTHADLQTDPVDVVNAYRAFRRPLSDRRVIVKGRRVGRPMVDRIFTSGMSAMASLALAGRFSDVNAQPKIFPRQLLDDMNSAPDDFSLDLYVLWLAHRKGYEVVEHPVRFEQRTHGEAKGGGTLRLKWKLTRRTLTFIRQLRRKIRTEGV